MRSYRKRMLEFANMGHLQLWYARIDEKNFIDAVPEQIRKSVKQFMAKARHRNHVQILDKMTDLIDDRKRIVEDKPLIVRETHTTDGVPIGEALDLFLKSYLPTLAEDRRQLLKRYRLLDAARKVVGVGSVGTRCWVLYLHGNVDDDPLFLQLKQATASVLEPYTTVSALPHHGQRVVTGQRVIQGGPDIFLGWGGSERLHFYVRQLRDMKGSFEILPNAALDPKLPRFRAYCELCGWALALAHAKSGDAALIAGYVGKSEELDEAIAQFSVAYADQTKKDFASLRRAAQEGKIEAASDQPLP